MYFVGEISDDFPLIISTKQSLSIICLPYQLFSSFNLQKSVILLYLSSKISHFFFIYLHKSISFIKYSLWETSGICHFKLDHAHS